MTILNLSNDASKSVTILNSGDYSPRYADAPTAQLMENDSMTVETLLRSIDGRLQTMDGRLQTMDGRIQTMDGRLENMDKRLDNMDKRLDKVGEDIVELKVQTAAIGACLVGVEQRLDRGEDRFDRQEKQQREADGRLIRIEEQIVRLPSWKSVGTMSATTVVSCGALFVWLAEGGAKALARLFE